MCKYLLVPNIRYEFPFFWTFIFNWNLALDAKKAMKPFTPKKCKKISWNWIFRLILGIGNYLFSIWTFLMRKIDVLVPFCHKKYCENICQNVCVENSYQYNNNIIIVKEKWKTYHELWEILRDFVFYSHLLSIYLITNQRPKQLHKQWEK